MSADLVAEKPRWLAGGGVINVLDCDSSSLSWWRRNSPILDLICSASCRGTTNPRRPKMAHLVVSEPVYLPRWRRAAAAVARVWRTVRVVVMSMQASVMDWP